jgi:hypothetical protein
MLPFGFSAKDLRLASGGLLFVPERSSKATLKSHSDTFDLISPHALSVTLGSSHIGTNVTLCYPLDEANYLTQVLQGIRSHDATGPIAIGRLKRIF